MWPHYADEHRGAVVGFDSEHSFFNRRVSDKDDLRHFRKVNYTHERPAIYLDRSEAVEIFYFKSRDWEYEHEWRLIVPLTDCARQIDRPPQLPICLFDVPPECIKTVITGCRMRETERFSLVSTIRRDPRFAHVRFERAVPDERLFVINRQHVRIDAIDAWMQIANQNSVTCGGSVTRSAAL